MESSIDYLVFQALARECDEFTENSLIDNWRSSKRQLSRKGIPQEFIDKYNFETDIKPHFIQSFIPNPYYLKKYLNSEFAFFFIRAESKKYQLLLNLLKNQLPTLSSFVCYGEMDVIVRILGTHKVFEHTETLLDNYGFTPIILKIDDIPYFYDIEIGSNQKPEKSSFSPEDIDQFLLANPESIDINTIKNLVESGVFLGKIFLENAHETGRLRAFMGIRFKYGMSKRDTKIFESALININEIEKDYRGSIPLTSIYRSSGHYHYLLEMIFDDQKQLDRVTDIIQDIDPKIGDTETLVLAKAHFKPLSFSINNESEIGKYVAIQNVFDKEFIPFTEKMFKQWPILESVFVNAGHENQFDAISFYRDMNELFKEGAHSIKSQINGFIFEIIRGILEGNDKSIEQSGLGFIKHVVEKEHRNLIKIILSTFFDGNPGELQKTFKAPNKYWERWGLADWANYKYPAWNKEPFYGRILSVPNNILRNLYTLGNIRNDFAHLREDIKKRSILVPIREVFTHSNELLIWLEITKRKIKSPSFSAKEIQEMVNISINDLQLSKLAVIELNQTEMLNLFTEMKTQTNTQWHELATKIKKYGDELTEIDEYTEKIFNELVIPAMKEKERGNAEKLIEFLKESSGSLSKEVIVSILSTILISALGLM